MYNTNFNDNPLIPRWTIRTDELTSWMMIAVLFMLTPVLPAGDIGISLVSFIEMNYKVKLPNIVYIVVWASFMAGYYYLVIIELFIKKILVNYSTTINILLIYLQGIVLACVLESYGLARFSAFVASIAQSIMSGLFGV
jgi:hypothetical protein